MASAAEKTLAVEWLAIMAIQTGDAIYEKKAGKVAGAGFLPSPQRYFATLIVFFFLAAVAAFSDRFARTATAFGGLAALAIAMATPKGAADPPLIGFAKWLASMTAYPPTTPTTVGSTSEPGTSTGGGGGLLSVSPSTPVGTVPAGPFVGTKVPQQGGSIAAQGGPGTQAILNWLHNLLYGNSGNNTAALTPTQLQQQGLGTTSTGALQQIYGVTP